MVTIGGVQSRVFATDVEASTRARFQTPAVAESTWEATGDGVAAVPAGVSSIEDMTLCFRLQPDVETAESATVVLLAWNVVAVETKSVLCRTASDAGRSEPLDAIRVAGEAARSRS